MHRCFATFSRVSINTGYAPKVRSYALALCRLAHTPSARAAHAAPRVDVFLLRTPAMSHINQGSDLHYGRLGERNGLWVVSDRNGGATAGRIFFFSEQALKSAKAGGHIVADDAFAVVPPPEGWQAFEAANRAAGAEVIADIRKRLTADAGRGAEPCLDLEAVTMAPVPESAARFTSFCGERGAVLDGARAGPRRARRRRQGRVGGAVRLPRNPRRAWRSQQRRCRGPGLCRAPGEFYFCEEGTRTAGGTFGQLLYFLDPRLGVPGFAMVKRSSSRSFPSRSLRPSAGFGKAHLKP